MTIELDPITGTDEDARREFTVRLATTTDMYLAGTITLAHFEDAARQLLAPYWSDRPHLHPKADYSPKPTSVTPRSTPTLRIAVQDAVRDCLDAGYAPAEIIECGELEIQTWQEEQPPAPIQPLCSCGHRYDHHMHHGAAAYCAGYCYDCLNCRSYSPAEVA